jgi:hypothetical protein
MLEEKAIRTDRWNALGTFGINASLPEFWLLKDVFHTLPLGVVTFLESEIESEFVLL